MRLSTSGSIPRVDHTLLVDALVPLREEWAALRFDAAGDVVNPVSGASLDGLRLLEGRHRVAGARYQVTIRTPVVAPDPDGQQALDAEMLGRPDVDWDEYGRRLAALSAPTGRIDESITGFTLRGDDGRALSVTLTDPAGLWIVDVDILHGRIPRVEITARADATAMLTTGGAPRWIARRVGGDASGSAAIDLATFEQRGGTSTFADGEGRLKLVRATATATVAPTPDTWDVVATADVTGKGLGRLALRLFRSRLQRSFDTAAASYWTGLPDTMVALRQFERQLRTVVDGEGGIAALIHVGLWEPERLEALGAKYGLE
jgi:hypothetical protein